MNIIDKTNIIDSSQEIKDKIQMLYQVSKCHSYRIAASVIYRAANHEETIWLI